MNAIAAAAISGLRKPSAASGMAAVFTRAVSVARLTAALTPSIRFSFRSILAAQDAQVIPPVASSATVTW